MLALEQLQATVMKALDHGPDYLPDHLFAGTHARVLAGMKVHANTISHARLVALEDTFPRTREWLGHDRFNEHSRRFLDWPGVTSRPLARIGKDFSHYLAVAGEAAGAPDLAAFEWAWLTAYHAPDAVALALAKLNGIEESALLDIVLARHPAASMGHVDAAVRETIGKEVPGLSEGFAILLTRPDAEVLVCAATSAMWSIFDALESPGSICNLLASISEPDCKDQLPPDDFMPALIALLEAGALQQVE